MTQHGEHGCLGRTLVPIHLGRRTRELAHAVPPIPLAFTRSVLVRQPYQRFHGVPRFLPRHCAPSTIVEWQRGELDIVQEHPNMRGEWHVFIRLSSRERRIERPIKIWRRRISNVFSEEADARDSQANNYIGRNYIYVHMVAKNICSCAEVFYA